MRIIVVILGLCALAIFLVSGALAAPPEPAALKATARPLVLDNFTNNRIDPSKWAIFLAGTGPSLAETNKRLEISLPAASTEDPNLQLFGGGLISRCRLSGDFDIQVDFDLPVFPYANGVRVVLSTSYSTSFAGAYTAMERTSLGLPADMPGWPREVYITHFEDWVGGTTQTSDTSGKLRLVRAGGVGSGYYYSGGSWVLIDTGPVTTSDVYPYVSATSHDYAFSDRDVRVAFDNVILNKGTCSS